MTNIFPLRSNQIKLNKKKYTFESKQGLMLQIFAILFSFFFCQATALKVLSASTNALSRLRSVPKQTCDTGISSV